jgi:hypothetical protein
LSSKVSQQTSSSVEHVARRAKRELTSSDRRGAHQLSVYRARPRLEPQPRRRAPHCSAPIGGAGRDSAVGLGRGRDANGKCPADANSNVPAGVQHAVAGVAISIGPLREHELVSRSTTAAVEHPSAA